MLLVQAVQALTLTASIATVTATALVAGITIPMGTGIPPSTLELLSTMEEILAESPQEI